MPPITGLLIRGHGSLPKAAEKFPGGGQCYRRLGKPLTITSAAVTYLQQPAANQQPANYGLAISVSAADKAPGWRSRQRPFTRGVAIVESPFTSRFEIPAQNANQALHLQRLLIPSA